MGAFSLPAFKFFLLANFFLYRSGMSIVWKRDSFMVARSLDATL